MSKNKNATADLFLLAALFLLSDLLFSFSLVLAQEPVAATAADIPRASGSCTCSELMRTISDGDLERACHFVKNNPDLFTFADIYCTANDVNAVATKAFCQCDCTYAHGATGEAKVCTSPPTNPDITVGCVCKYDDEDDYVPDRPNPSNPCSPGDDDSGSSRSRTQGKTETKCSYSSPGKRNSSSSRNCFAEPCKTLFNGLLLTAVCDVPNGDYSLTLESSGKKCPLSGCDLCALDCYCVHGAQAPYGVCDSDPKTGERFCYCFI